MPLVILGGGLLIIGAVVWAALRNKSEQSTTMTQPFDEATARRHADRHRAAEEAGLVRAGTADAIEAGIARGQLVIPVDAGLEPIAYTASGEIVSALDGPITTLGFVGRLDSSTEDSYTEDAEDGEYVTLISVGMLVDLLVLDDRPSEGGVPQRVAVDRFFAELATFAGTSIEGLTMRKIREAMRMNPSHPLSRGVTSSDPDRYVGPYIIETVGTGAPGPVKGMSGLHAGRILRRNFANWASEFVERYRRLEFEVGESRRVRAEEAARSARTAGATSTNPRTGNLVVSVTGSRSESGETIYVSSRPRLGAAPTETATPGTVRR